MADARAARKARGCTQVRMRCMQAPVQNTVPRDFVFGAGANLPLPNFSNIISMMAPDS